MTKYPYATEIMDGCQGAMNALRQATERLCSTVDTIEAFRMFMERHVYAVWDFMSVAYRVLDIVRPVTEHAAWTPSKADPSLVRAIQEMIMCEEGDIMPDGRILSHFEMYLEAMKEAGANTTEVNCVVGMATNNPNPKLDAWMSLPDSVRNFTQPNLRTALSTAGEDKFATAVAFAYGRENIIPEMFQMIIDRFSLSKEDMPMFFYYLDRHIEVDGEEHGDAAYGVVEMMLKRNVYTLCDIREGVGYKRAKELAKQAILHRAAFFNAIADEIIASR